MSDSSTIQLPKIRINAEHQRLIWLYFSPSMLVGGICLYLLIIFVVNDFALLYSDPTQFFESLKNISTFGYIISLFLLVFTIRNSIQQDLKSQFWDQLRMSSLSAWQMTWTRLLSAPLLAWIGIFISVTLFSISEYIQQLYDPDTAIPLLYSLVTLLSGLLIAYSISAITLLNYLQFNRSQKEWQGSILQCILLYIILSIFSSLILSEFDTLYPNLNEEFSLHFDKVYILFGGLIIGTVFLGLGVWRSMAYKLHLRHSNVYWLVAILILPFILWLYQFVWATHSQFVFLYTSLIYGWGILISASTQNNSFSNFNAAQQWFRQKQWLPALQLLPLWVILLPLYFFVLSLYCLIFHLEFLAHHFSFVLYLLCYVALSLIFVNFSRRFNAINLSLVIFLILYCLTLGF